MRGKSLFRTLLLGTMVSCGLSCATMINENEPPGAAPNAKKGEVAYNPHGVDELVRSRRNDALQKIEEHCGGKKYKITKEETRSTRDGVGTNSIAGSIAVVGATELRHINFECE